jgi:hypothetical protein
VLGIEVAALDPLGQVDFLVGRQQWILADLLQEQLERVGGRDGEVVVRIGDLLRNVAPAVVAELDPAVLDLVEERLDVVFVEVDRLDELVQLGQLDAAAVLTFREEVCDALLIPSFSSRCDRSALPNRGPCLCSRWPENVCGESTRRTKERGAGALPSAPAPREPFGPW